MSEQIQPISRVKPLGEVEILAAKQTPHGLFGKAALAKGAQATIIGGRPPFSAGLAIRIGLAIADAWLRCGQLGGELGAARVARKTRLPSLRQGGTQEV